MLSWPGIRRNRGPAWAGTLARHHRNTQQGKGRTETIDVGPIAVTVIKDADGNIIGGGVGLSAPQPGASINKTNTQVRQQVSANATAKAVGGAVVKGVSDAKNAAATTVKNQVSKVIPPLPCAGKTKC